MSMKGRDSCKLMLLNKNHLFSLWIVMSLHEALLYERQSEGKVKCSLCARRCLISDDSVSYTHLTLPTNREV